MATRKIIFRGERKKNGDWVHGDLSYHRDGRVYIRRWDNLQFNPAYNAYEIDPATVGQYTGLNDKNGKKIFEGDIVGYCWYDAAMNFRIDFVSGEFLAVPVEKRKDVWAIRISGQGESFEVIGNIHDNPELLEGGRIDG